jgi:DNA-binding response OmpR family regulator
MKILVVDDDRGIVKTTCDILKFKGHDPIPAFNGEEGVEKVRSEAPDCVLMDIKMPGINGVEAMRRMKEIAPAMPVVLVSAYATDGLIEEARQTGADAVLSKPLDFEMVLASLSLLRKEDIILIVDDDPNFLKTLEDVLTARGYQVKTETGANNVLADMEAQESLVVLLDLKLGSVNGVDILKQIREKHPTKPVIMVTGYGKEMGGSIETGLKLGACTCIYKPFEMNAVIDLVEEIRLNQLKNLLGAS